MLILALQMHVHLFHHVQGAPIDYVGVAVAAFASWGGVPGPGEPVLIAAAVFASKHKLDITPLIFWAWVGATTGGVVGWLVGMKGGRAILTAPGPLRRIRRNAAAKGEEVFRRYEVLAILVTPSWVAGINRARARVYLPVNAVSAMLLWALPIAVGAYYAGPPILDLISDLGTALAIILGLVLVGVAVEELLRHRRRRAQDGVAR
jgi:membrane protein DedA with SNARE-associated domain